jgi:intracellular multiplication protein IcmP
MSAKGEEDPTWALLLMFAIVGGFGWAVWHFLQDEILWVLRYVRLAELGVMSLFSAHARACLSWLWQARPGMEIPSVGVVQAASACYGPELAQLPPIEALKYYNFTSQSLLSMTVLVAQPMRWIGAAGCIAVAVYGYRYTPLNKYKKRHTLESFIQAQADMWPVIKPVVNFNPTKASARIPGDTIPDKLPIFAEALNPEEWVSFHRIPVVNSVPDRELARRAFLLQLGPRWRGVRSLPPYMLCLYAAFALQGVQKREECDVLLGKLALCWSQEKGFVPSAEIVQEVRKLIDDPAVGGKALEIANRHAFRTTAFLGVLKWARMMGGVLAPGQFVWLRAVDRALWYPANNLGRRSFHTEGAGALAHFMAEEGAGKALSIPRIETAIITLNTYFAKSPIKIPPRAEPASLQARAQQ